ncbi:hypothetical protein [Streptomyces sp. G45]|uniref:hypothetical protein n=1 Tax=Streptomyces sp. G45 TaxID=3406627 RepID=UPI003C16EE3B
MSQPLPLAYWCHLDVSPPPQEQPGPLGAVTDTPLLSGITTPSPGVALIWMRAGVSDVAAELDAASSDAATGWLDDPSNARAVLRDLRKGRPLRFELLTASETWTWAVSPVRRLPLLGDGAWPERRTGLPPIAFWTQRP